MQSLNVFNMLQSMQIVGQNFSVMMFGAPPPEPELDFINRLPHEMMSRIFRAVMTPPNDRKEMGPKDAYMTPVFSASLPITPFPLTQVCRRWRYIAQGTRQLWKSIAIGRPSKQLIHRVELWMQFVTGPLAIDFFQREPESLEDMEATAEIIDLLCSRYKQWYDVKIHLHQDVFPPSIAANLHLISTLSSPMLKSFVISNCYNFVSSEEAVANAWTSLNKIRTLRTIKWLSSDLLFRPAECLLQSLTSLTLKGLSARELIRGVTACVNLRELDVVVYNGDGIYGAKLKQVRPVIHQHLEHIALTGEPRELQGVLHSFDLPKLVSVEMNYADASTCQYLWHLLHRSSSNLKRLMMQVSGVDDKQLADWLDLNYLQNLETLVITGAEIKDEVFLKLTVFPPSENRRHYFPYLQNLTLSFCSADMDEDVFIRMLGSRLFTGDGEPYKVELTKAAFLVQNKTNQMRLYEEMCKSCITGTYKSYVDSKGWNNRKVIIQQQ